MVIKKYNWGLPWIQLRNFWYGWLFINYNIQDTGYIWLLTLVAIYEHISYFITYYSLGLFKYFITYLYRIRMSACRQLCNPHNQRSLTLSPQYMQGSLSFESCWRLWRETGIVLYRVSQRKVCTRLKRDSNSRMNRTAGRILTYPCIHVSCDGNVSGHFWDTM